MIVETLDDSVRHRRDEIADAAAKIFHPSVRPIVATVNGREAEIVGSSMLLAVAGRRFVVTAAHILDRIDSAALYVIGAVHSEPVQLLGKMHTTAKPSSGRNSDKIDLAFWEMDGRLVEKLGSVRFIDGAMISRNRASTISRIYMALGYPVSRNRRNADRAFRTIRPSLSKYTAELVTGLEAAKKFGVSGDRHLFLKYQKFSVTRTGEKRRTFRPNGLSGGALIDLGNFGSPERYIGGTTRAGYVAGMIIERIEWPSTIVAIKIQTVIEAIETHAN